MGSKAGRVVKGGIGVSPGAMLTQSTWPIVQMGA